MSLQTYLVQNKDIKFTCISTSVCVCVYVTWNCLFLMWNTSVFMAILFWHNTKLTKGMAGALRETLTHTDTPHRKTLQLFIGPIKVMSCHCFPSNNICTGRTHLSLEAPSVWLWICGNEDMRTCGHVDMRTDWRQRWWRHSFKNHHPVYFCLFHWLGAENKRKQRQKKEKRRKRTSDKSQIYQPINDPELRSSSHECISGGCVITHQR